MQPKIKVGGLAGESLGLSLEQLANFVRMGWPAILLMVPSAIFMEMSTTQISWNESAITDWASWVKGVALSFFGWIVLIPTIVRHYQVAANEAEIPGSILYLKWGNRETKFLLAAILLFLLICFAGLGALVPFMVLTFICSLMSVSAGVMTALQFVGFGFFALLFVWFMVRSLLILPSVAIEGRIQFGKAFDQTKGYFWRLLGVQIALMLAMIVAQILVYLAALVLGLLLSLTPLTFEGWSLGNILIMTLSAIVSFFFSLVYIVLGGLVWQRFNNPDSLTVADAQFAD
ncbi:hypothetical protein [Parvularcula marina]|uniref:hypothetical protein n=1 Tax=Parvularcula marina TaxID=2292771 RepID=UPI003516A988